MLLNVQQSSVGFHKTSSFCVRPESRTLASSISSSRMLYGLSIQVHELQEPISILTEMQTFSSCTKKVQCSPICVDNKQKKETK